LVFKLFIHFREHEFSILYNMEYSILYRLIALVPYQLVSTNRIYPSDQYIMYNILLLICGSGDGISIAQFQSGHFSL